MSLSALDRARKIRVLLFDVDGVLTDGAIWFLPSAGSSQSTVLVEAKGFDAHDGSGISLARIGGIKCGIVTKRSSDAVAMRARDLRLEYVYLGQSYKMQAVREIMQKESITVEEIAYVGDDVIDLPVMRLCGLAIAVPNARPQVKAAAHHVTKNPGGHGAGRDAIEFILEAKGILDQCIEKYIDESNPI
jgi:3-deoxy-D-manno-octulosonate 8-phosphate phosphatase (KDO 8-P phosphatase)